MSEPTRPRDLVMWFEGALSAAASGTTPCCNLCMIEQRAAVRALREVARPGMSESEIAAAAWAWMHESPDSPWAWKKRLWSQQPDADGDD